LNEFNGKNSCQEFLAWTLLQAVLDLKNRMGDEKWNFGYLAKVRHTHSPFSDTPLGKWYEVVAE